MSRMIDIGIEASDQALPTPANENADPAPIDRSLSAVMREIAWSLSGWLFFVVAVQLLLYGTHLI